MYITRVPNRASPPAVLLRESYREGGKVKNRTVANLSSWPEAKVEALSRALKGLPPAGLEGMVEVARSLPHGHVAAVLGTVRERGLEELIDPAPSRQAPGDLERAPRGGGRGGLALQHPGQRVDLRLGPGRQVGQGAVLHLARLAVAFPQQHRRR